MSTTLGMVGLGRMGGNMSRRLARGGLDVLAWDRAPEARGALGTEARVKAADTLDALVAALAAPRIVWLMLPAGAPTESTIDLLLSRLARGDVVVDGGNAFYKDSQRHAATLSARGIHFVDAGVSGGVWGLEYGYGLMVGGEPDAISAESP